MGNYAEVLKKYIGASGKLTRFRGDFCRFRVAFQIEDPDILKDLRKQGAELHKLIEIGDDYAVFKSPHNTVFLPLHLLIVED